MNRTVRVEQLGCPVPRNVVDRVMLGHGSGGRMSAELFREVFLPAFANPILEAQEDQAAVQIPGSSLRLAFTTDSFVVRPIFFPGGDIGCLSVHGTINDLAVGGARPLYLAAAFIVEEGLPLESLERITQSMQTACRASGVQLVTGDTKVVDQGKGDELFITTTGIGLIPDGIQLSCHNPKPGDKILLSGTLGDHGIAIMSSR